MRRTASPQPPLGLRRAVLGWGVPCATPPVWHSVGSLFRYGALDSHPLFPSHVVSGRCVLSAAAAGAPAGVVSAFAGPRRWCAGAVLDVTPLPPHVRAAHGPPPPPRGRVQRLFGEVRGPKWGHPRPQTGHGHCHLGIPRWARDRGGAGGGGCGGRLGDVSARA